MSTPLKAKTGDCVACKTATSKRRRLVIESEAGRKHEIKEKLLRFGGINVVSGMLCRTCLYTIDSLTKKADAFMSMCQASQVSFKRCAKPPEASNYVPVPDPPRPRDRPSPKSRIRLPMSTSSYEVLAISTPRPMVSILDFKPLNQTMMERLIQSIRQ